MSFWIRSGGLKTSSSPKGPRYYKYDGSLRFSTATYDCVVQCDEKETIDRLSKQDFIDIAHSASNHGRCRILNNPPPPTSSSSQNKDDRHNELAAASEPEPVRPTPPSLSPSPSNAASRCPDGVQSRNRAMVNDDRSVNAMDSDLEYPSICTLGAAMSFDTVTTADTASQSAYSPPIGLAQSHCVLSNDDAIGCKLTRSRSARRFRRGSAPIISRSRSTATMPERMSLAVDSKEMAVSHSFTLSLSL